jgi:hypothetical protein
MQKFCLISGRKSVFGMLVAFGLAILVPSLRAQQNQTGSDSPQAAWSTIQQLVKDMETAVQSKNLHGIHDPTMKIRAPIKTLKQHSSMLSGDKGQKIAAALKHETGPPRPGSFVGTVLRRSLRENAPPLVS